MNNICLALLKIKLFSKALFGNHTTDDGSTCLISNAIDWDVHDYHTNKGGDGIPSMMAYQCHKCGKTFTI